MAKLAILRFLSNTLYLLLLIAFLIFVQFRKHALTFQLGDFTVALYQGNQNSRTNFTQAKVEGRAMELKFGGHNSELKEGLFEKPLKLLGYENGNNTLSLNFEGGVCIRFLLDQDRYFVIHADKLPSEAASIKVAFCLSPKATWEKQDDTGLVQLKYKKQILDFFLNKGTSYEDLALNRLYLSKQPIKLGPFVKATVSQTNLSKLDQPKSITDKELEIGKKTIKKFSENELAMEKANYREKAYKGLTERYDKNKGTWLKGKTYTFSEKALISTLAESLMQGTYAYQYSLMKDLPLRYPDMTGVKSALYLGNIINKNDQTKEKKREEFSKFFSESVLNMLVIEDMAESLYMYANASEFDRLLKLWESTSALEQDWSLSQIGQFITNYTRTRQLLNKKASNDFLKMLDRLLLLYGNFYEETYVLMENGKENWQASLQIAWSILALTNIKEEDSLRERARTLMTGILKLADKQGNIIGANSSVYPEDIYTYVSNTPYLPKIIVLDASQRSWILLTSQVLDKEITQGSYNFHLGFYPEFAEHLILNGIDYPHAVIFRGITWRTDPQFQIYTDGWSYLTKSRSLYLKISHFLGKNVDLSVETNEGAPSP